MEITVHARDHQAGIHQRAAIGFSYRRRLVSLVLDLARADSRHFVPFVRIKSAEADLPVRHARLVHHVNKRQEHL